MTRRSEGAGKSTFAEAVEIHTRQQVKREGAARAASQGTSLSEQFDEIERSLGDVAREYRPAAIGATMVLRGEVPDRELKGEVRARLTKLHGDKWRAGR